MHKPHFQLSFPYISYVSSILHFAIRAATDGTFRVTDVSDYYTSYEIKPHVSQFSDHRHRILFVPRMILFSKSSQERILLHFQLFSCVEEYFQVSSAFSLFHISLNSILPMIKKNEQLFIFICSATKIIFPTLSSLAHFTFHYFFGAVFIIFLLFAAHSLSMRIGIEHSNLPFFSFSLHRESWFEEDERLK